jgi:hypothetical protein
LVLVLFVKPYTRRDEMSACLPGGTTNKVLRSRCIGIWMRWRHTSLWYRVASAAAAAVAVALIVYGILLARRTPRLVLDDYGAYRSFDVDTPRLPVWTPPEGTLWQSVRGGGGGCPPPHAYTLLIRRSCTGSSGRRRQPHFCMSVCARGRVSVWSRVCVLLFALMVVPLWRMTTPTAALPRARFGARE